MALPTRGGEVKLHLAQLTHGHLQLVYDSVILILQRRSNFLLQKFPQIFQRHLQQALWGRAENTAGSEQGLGLTPQLCFGKSTSTECVALVLTR